MVGAYCRQYRMSKKVTLKDLTQSDNIKTLSAFESGRSTNIEHLFLYIKLSVELDDYNNFYSGLILNLGV